MRAVFAVAWIACSVGAPPGFSGGTTNRWSVSLIGPLEGGLLFVPVYVNDKGPYVFVIDPDSRSTVVDGQVVNEAGLRVHRKFNGSHDERGERVQILTTEISSLRVGDLTVSGRTMEAVNGRVLDVRGRRVHGIIGEDLVRTSTAFGYDRDRGTATITAESSFTKPRDTIELPFEPSNHNRLLVAAHVNGIPATLHVDLGAQASQLVPSVWSGAKLGTVPIDGEVINEFGNHYRVSRQSTPVAVTLDGLPVTAEISFIPYADQFEEHTPVHGALGPEFFDAYSVTLWSSGRRFYLSPRVTVPPRTRIARWPTLAGCVHLGCVQLALAEDKLDVTREVAGGLEILVEADRPLPRLAIALPANVDRLESRLKPEYRNAALTVIDASPFPRTCPDASGCVYQLGAAH